MPASTSQLVNASNNDIVDSLRSIGLDSMVKLPAIIVVGDTSAGKSSLLTALSGLQFPSDPDICTRCPTEVMLTRGQKKSAVVTLRHFPGMCQQKDFQKALNDDWSDFASVITEATKCLTAGFDPSYITPSAIVVRAEAPDLPDVTLIDLPGLVAATGIGQSNSIIDSTRKMIHMHMQSSRSVILCVLPASTGFQNSAILTMAKDPECDPTGIRTLGIITKPDLVDKGAESAAVSLAKNEKVELRLGWHTVKLRSQQDLMKNKTLVQAEEEELFFEQDPWSTLETSQVGIRRLQSRLQKLLAQRVQSELPVVLAEVKSRLMQEEGKLAGLGHDYDNVMAQREAFVTLLGQCAAILEAACSGRYEGDFFFQAAPKYGNNLRAHIFMLEKTFMDKISQTRFMCIGHYGVGDKVVYNGTKGRVGAVLPGGRLGVSRVGGEYFEAEVSVVLPDHSDTLERLGSSRGDTLPCFENDSVFRSFVAEQLAPWSTPAAELCHGTAKLLKELAARVVEHVVPPSLSQLRAFLKGAIDQAIGRCLSKLEVRMQELLQQERERPYTQNPDYVTLLTQHRSQLQSKIQQAGFKQQATEVALASFGFSSAEEAMAVEFEFRSAAYLEVASKRFSDEMPRIVNTILVKPVLREVNVLQAQAADSKLATIFALDDGVKQERALLRSRVSMLRDALKVLEGNSL